MMKMKGRLATLASCVILGTASLLWGAQAHALPITLTYDPGTSDVRITDTSGLCVGCSVSVKKRANPVDIVFDALGQTKGFRFFSAFAQGAGVGSATFEAELGFSAPGEGAVSSTATGRGTYLGVIFFGTGLAGGQIKWLEQPDVLSFSDGTQVALNLRNAAGSCVGSDCKGGLKVNVRARTTLTAVPEPTGIALMGVGLLAFGIAARRRRR